MASSNDDNSLSSDNRYGFHANVLNQKEGVPSDFVLTQVAEPIRKLLVTAEKAASLKSGNPVYEESVAALKVLYSTVNTLLKSHDMVVKTDVELNETSRPFKP